MGQIHPTKYDLFVGSSSSYTAEKVRLLNELFIASCIVRRDSVNILINGNEGAIEHRGVEASLYMERPFAQCVSDFGGSCSESAFQA